MKALFATLLLALAVQTPAHAATDNTLTQFSDSAIKCVKHYKYANPNDQLDVIELDPEHLRIEIANHGDAVSGFVANMDIVDGSLYLYNPANFHLLFCQP